MPIWDLLNRSKYVPAIVHRRRFMVCKSNRCESFLPKVGFCSICGCATRFKSMLNSESCPKGFWK